MIRSREHIIAAIDKLAEVWLRNPHLSLCDLASAMVRQACITCRHCPIGMISEGAGHLVHDDTDLVNLLDIELNCESL